LPVLVYIAGVEPKTAVAMSLVVVGATSIAGAYLHSRDTGIHLKAAAFLGGAGIPGAFLGSTFTRMVSSSTLMLVFSSLMLAVGVFMFKGGVKHRPIGQCSFLRCAGIGLGVGVLTGFLGVGGGFLIVPALVLFTGLEMKKAIGTSLAIIALNSASGLAAHIRWAHIDWALTGVFLFSSLLGMAIGLTAVRRISAAILTRAFASVLVLTALVIGGIQLLRIGS
jgi:uncharacterized protein